MDKTMARLAKIQSVQKCVNAEGRVFFRVRYPAGSRSHRFQDGTVSRRTIYKDKRFTNERSARDFATDLRREHREADFGHQTHKIKKSATSSLLWP